MFKWETQEFSLWSPTDLGSNSSCVTSDKLLDLPKLVFFTCQMGIKMLLTQ